MTAPPTGPVRTVATAGHVDHGKSTLVRALTGTDPDRFAEERARGLSIDLGFAWCNLPSGTTVGFVDVPGHMRFVANMLAGVGAVEVAVLVVDPGEGWMRQTHEHVAILGLLGIDDGVVVLTRADVVGSLALARARLEHDHHAAGTSVAEWPVVAADGVSGRGIDDVVAALDAVLAGAPPPRDDDRPRLWVDRSFSAPGAGTVVTGTLAGGAFGVDDRVEVHPGGHGARIRGIEQHHAARDRVGPGGRVALVLAGIDRTAVSRGAAVVRPGHWLPAAVVDVEVTTIGSAPLDGRADLHAHVGSGAHRARLRPLDEASGHARLRLPVPLPLAPGDRVVIRSSGRATTVGGATILDVAPPRRTRDARARRHLPPAVRAVANAPWSSVDDLVPLLGGGPDAARDTLAAAVQADAVRSVGGRLVPRGEADRLLAAARAHVRDHHAAELDSPGPSVAELATRLGLDRDRARNLLASEDELVVEHDVVRSRAQRPVGQDGAGRRLLDALGAAPFAPPPPASLGVSPEVVRALERGGRVVVLGGIAFASDAVADARRIVARAVLDQGTLTLAEVRDRLETSRRYAVALLAACDAEGLTRRRGDVREPGPRAAAVAGRPG